MSNNVMQEISQTTYGDTLTSELEPVTQISGDYGLLTNVLTVTDSNSSGANSVQDGLFSSQTGTAADGLASILSLREVRFRPGQGILARISAKFDTPAANSQQGAGLITGEDSFVFGYQGLDFGIINAFDGVSEYQELDITVAAAGAENATITIDGVGYTVPLTAGTIQHNAYEMAVSLSAQVPNYTITSNGTQVLAQALISGAQGSFVFSSATATAAWTQLAIGLAPAVDFIAQADWNADKRATGDAQDILDPQKGNLFQIQTCMEFSGVRFWVEDSKTNEPVLVHTLQYSNLFTVPIAKNPTYRVGWLARNLGNTTNINLNGGSAGIFVEGRINYSNPPRSDSNNQLAVGTSQTSILTIRSRSTFNNKVNRVDVLPLLLSISSQSNKSTFFRVLLNPVFAGDLNFSYLNKTSSVVETAKDSVTVSGGTELAAITISPNSGDVLRFNEAANADTLVLPGFVVCVVGQVASGAASDMQAAFTIREDL